MSGKGALSPPPGVVPDFQNPPSIMPAVRAADIFMLVLASVATAIRVYSKVFIVKQTIWADYTMIFAYLSFLVYYILISQAFAYGAGVHQWNVPVTDMPDFAYWGWISECFYSLCIASVRLTLCLQFINIFVVIQDRRFWAVVAFIAVTMAYYTAQLFFCIFQCTPVEKAWNSRLEGRCLNAQFQRFIITTGVFNLLGDLLMLAFPLYCIWGLKASMGRRLAIGALFMVGMLAIIASVMRIVYSISNNGSDDLTYTLTQVAECTFGEVCAGILVGNLIIFPRFVDSAIKGIRVWSSARSSGSDHSLEAVQTSSAPKKGQQIVTAHRI